MISEAELKKWNEQIKERELFRKKDKGKAFKFLDENFNSEYIETKEGVAWGKIICKRCGKSHLWREWGRNMTRAFTVMKWHVILKHNKKLGTFIKNKRADEWFCERHQEVNE